MSALDEHLKKHRKKIIDREEKTFGEILDAYQQIEKELKKSFTELQAQIKNAQDNDEQISLSWFYRNRRLKNLLAQVREQITVFGGKTKKIIEREQKAAIEIGVRQAEDSFNIQTKNNTADFGSKLNNKSVETAVGIMGDGSPIIEYFEKQLAPMVAEAIKTEIVKAAALGTDFKTIGKRLEKTGQITKYRALSVARTEVNRVRREAARQIYQENNDIVQMWEWVSSKSPRTCPLCLAMDGKRFPLSEPFPQHINCRCTMIAVIEGLPRPKRTIGNDWFEKQTDETKAKILGKESFAAYQENGLTLDDFVAFRNDKRFGKSVTRKPLAKILADKGIDAKTPTSKLSNSKTPKSAVKVPEFKNVKEAAMWIETTYPNLQADFSQTKLETLQPTIKEFVRLSQEFPEVNRRLEYIGTYRDRTKKYHTGRGNRFSGETAHASVNGKRIGLNPKFYNKTDLLKRALDLSEESKWLVSNKTESPLTHEFGHHIEFWLKSNQANSVTALKSTKYEFRQILDKFYAKFHQDLRFKPGTNYAEWKQRKEALEKDVSRYGVKNEAELFAESFAASVFKPESKQGQLLKNFLDVVKELEFNENGKSMVSATEADIQEAERKFAAIMKKFEFLDKLP